MSHEYREPLLKYVETEMPDGILLITCGLPATYKTETSEEIARIKGYPIVRTDLVRRELLKNEDIFDEAVASNMNKRLLVYDETFRLAEETLGKGKGVIIDATFITQSLRRRAAGIAAGQGRTLVILQTQSPRQVSIARIARRTRERYESNALTEQAYANNEKKFERVDLDDLKSLYPRLHVKHILVDTAQDSPDGWHVIRVEER